MVFEVKIQNYRYSWPKIIIERLFILVCGLFIKMWFGLWHGISGEILNIKYYLNLFNHF